MNLLCTFVIQKERRCNNEMKETKRLIYQVINILAMLENEGNQPMVQEAINLLYEVLSLIRENENE